MMREVRKWYSPLRAGEYWLRMHLREFLGSMCLYGWYLHGTQGFPYVIQGKPLNLLNSKFLIYTMKSIFILTQCFIGLDY